MPELHYLLLGASQRLSPSLDFDPVRFRDELHACSRWPFLDYLRCTSASEPDDGEEGDPAWPGALLIDHPRGGGATRFLDLYAAKLKQDGFRTIRARRIGTKTPLFAIGSGAAARLISLDASLAQTVAERRVSRLVVNHLIDLPGDAFAWVPALAAALGVDYELVLHDYYLACPRVNLVDREGRYCGLPPVEVCVSCLKGSGIDPARWRMQARVLMEGAARITAPSADLAQRIGSLAPAAAIEIFEPEATTVGIACRARLCSGAPLRIGIIGALNRPKGFDVVERLARTIHRERAPVTLALLGASMDNARLRRAGVEVLGRYRDEDAAAMLATIRPDVLLFPAIWPETWSFTLTHALRSGIEILAFDIGAIADRLRRAGTGRLLPYAMHDDPAALLAELISIRSERAIGAAA